MPTISAGKTYYRLRIVSSSPTTEIWIGCDKGMFVERDTGTLETGLLKGRYTIEFGLGNTTYPIDLDRDTELTQEIIESGPSCPRPVVTLDDDDSND